MKTHLLFTILFILACACSKDELLAPEKENELKCAPVYQEGPLVTDIDGNIYTSVKVGRQLWLSRDLRVTHFNNGEEIPYLTASSTEGAYCYFNNDVNRPAVYGLLYNGYIINDERGVCPTGWHIPTEREFFELVHYLDNRATLKREIVSLTAGSMLKIAAEGYWLENPGTNDVGWSALPGGRFSNGDFGMSGVVGTWWTSTEYAPNPIAQMYYQLTFGNSIVYHSFLNKGFGMSIRCLKD